MIKSSSNGKKVKFSRKKKKKQNPSNKTFCLEESGKVFNAKLQLFNLSQEQWNPSTPPKNSEYNSQNNIKNFESWYGEVLPEKKNAFETKKKRSISNLGKKKETLKTEKKEQNIRSSSNLGWPSSCIKRCMTSLEKNRHQRIKQQSMNERRISKKVPVLRRELAQKIIQILPSSPEKTEEQQIKEKMTVKKSTVRGKTESPFYEKKSQMKKALLNSWRSKLKGFCSSSIFNLPFGVFFQPFVEPNQRLSTH